MGEKPPCRQAGPAGRPQNSHQKKNDRDSHGFTMHSKAKNYQIVKRLPPGRSLRADSARLITLQPLALFVR